MGGGEKSEMVWMMGVYKREGLIIRLVQIADATGNEQSFIILVAVAKVTGCAIAIDEIM
jgi:hypothetical protein